MIQKTRKALGGAAAAAYGSMARFSEHVQRERRMARGLMAGGAGGDAGGPGVSEARFAAHAAAGVRADAGLRVPQRRGQGAAGPRAGAAEGTDGRDRAPAAQAGAAVPVLPESDAFRKLLSSGSRHAETASHRRRNAAIMSPFRQSSENARPHRRHRCRCAPACIQAVPTGMKTTSLCPIDRENRAWAFDPGRRPTSAAAAIAAPHQPAPMEAAFDPCSNESRQKLCP